MRYYAAWMRAEAQQRIGHLYPTVRLPSRSGRVQGPADRRGHGEGVEATVIAWLWARTVRCPNPACGAQMPLVRSFWLSARKGHEAWVDPMVDQAAKSVRFEVRTGRGAPPEGTVNRRGARCVVCGQAVPFAHVRAEGKAGRMSARLMAIVANGEKGRAYLPPLEEHVRLAQTARPAWHPDAKLPQNPRDFKTPNYGMTTFADLFTPRQLVALTTFSDLVGEARERVRRDAVAAGIPDDGASLDQGGRGAAAYADAVVTYLALAVSRLADYSNALCTWNPTNGNIRNLFQRQAIPMAWDFAEANPVQGKLAFDGVAGWVADGLSNAPTSSQPARVEQLDACVATIDFATPPVVSTDPPYYDNIGYSDLSDFFYVWLRRSLRDVYPLEFSTVLTPKEAELIASPYRFEGSQQAAEEHFRSGFRRAFENVAAVANRAFPITVYYAFKQQEDDSEDGQDRASTGWETMLEGLIESGFQITGTLPVRTTKKARSVARDANALASAIVIVARHRSGSAPLATGREFVSALKKEMPAGLRSLMEANIAPVDFAQAAIGPGMAVYSRYGKVLQADGSPMPVRTALQLINAELDEYLTALEGELDPDTRFCLAWFEAHGMDEAAFGEADVLARAKNTSVHGLAQDGTLRAQAGKVRLLRRDEYPDDWDPARDRRLTVWECTQYLIRALERDGEEGAARLAVRLGGGRSEEARALAYRLYAICERKGWTQEALAYNLLAAAWGEVQSKAAALPWQYQQGQLPSGS